MDHGRPEYAHDGSGMFTSMTGYKGSKTGNQHDLTQAV